MKKLDFFASFMTDTCFSYLTLARNLKNWLISLMNNKVSLYVSTSDIKCAFTLRDITTLHILAIRSISWPKTISKTCSVFLAVNNFVSRWAFVPYWLSYHVKVVSSCNYVIVKLAMNELKSLLTENFQIIGVKQNS